MAHVNGTPYAHQAELGEKEPSRAAYHREAAVEALTHGAEWKQVAYAHSLLALEARVEELAVYVARLG